mgnify:FL=1|tara:strand:- start:498 stop:1718 length:1221 start_codon:yes stop_codon:yes gene_type:complete
MARLIQSIFSGGKTGATGSGGFTDEELSDYQKALLRGKQAAGKTGNPITAAAGGLLGQMARKKFFPTDEEEANKVLKQAMAQVAETIDPSDSLNFNREVIGLLSVMAQNKKNPVLAGIISEESQKVKDAEVNKEKDRLYVLTAQTKLRQDILNVKTAEQKAEYDNLVRLIRSKGRFVDPEKITNVENKYRDEYKKKWDEYSLRANAFKSMLTNIANDTKAGDLAAIIAYFKTLDPNSAVLTGEVDLAKKAQELGGLALTVWNSWQDGSGLTPKLKQELAQAASSSVNTASQSLKVEQDFYTQLADRKGLNVDSIVYGEALQRYEFDNDNFDPKNTDTWGSFVEIPLPEEVTKEEKLKLEPATESVITSNPYNASGDDNFEETRQNLLDKLQTVLLPVEDEEEEDNQ